MRRPPTCRRRNTLCVVLILLICLVSLTGVQAVSTQTTAAAVEPGCEDITYPSLPLSSPWEETYSDTIDNGSTQEWTGGEIVSVGADGDCSLLVSDGESETLTATTINGTRGVVAGTIDLGSNASVRLGANGSTQGGSTNETDDVAISNPGPDYSTRTVITAGQSSEAVMLSSGRFFQFMIQQDNGTARVAVWNVEDDWDGQWDVETESVTHEGDWQLALDGRAFLDGVVVGAKEPSERTTRTVSEDTETPPSTTETAETTTEDEFPGPGQNPDGDNRNPDYGSGDSAQDDSAGGSVFLGVVLLIGGALGVRYARPLTRFGEQIDAIGSTTPPSEVEAADWNVALSKIIAAGFALFGLYLVAKGIL